MKQKLAKIADILGKEFDFVIVGGGTAGCVVAARLSENPNISVALLEAGSAHFDDPLVSDPFRWTKIIDNPKYDWKYLTTPQPGLHGEPTMWPRGRGLGGTSQINGLPGLKPAAWAGLGLGSGSGLGSTLPQAQARALSPSRARTSLVWNLQQREEMDAVGELGNEGWNWETFHKYAKKVQRFCPPDPNERSEFKNLYKSDAVGHDGPIPLSFGRDSCGADAAWQRALAENGVDTISTALDGDIAGTWKSVSNVDPHADEVAATAVEFEHCGQVHKVFARKEVIVSAGHVFPSAVESPHVLELSGIGDRKILEPLGIPVQLDLPSVGTNVQEHIAMAVSQIKMVEDRGLITSTMLDNKGLSEKIWMEFGLKDSFKLSLNNFSFVPIQIGSERAEQLVQKQSAKIAKGDYPLGLKASYEKQLELLENPKVPDFEMMFLPFPILMPPPVPDKPYITIFPIVSRPFTRGTIHVQSADPKAWPAIDPHYYEEDIDLDIMVDATKFVRKVTQTEPFKSLVVEEQLPGPSVNTDEEMYEYARKYTYSGWHTAGSMSMMPRDKGGVVDPRFRVYGTKNIRVVDLSILPIHTAVHPQATVYAIAEMACDIVRHAYQ
ncbi:uncharacterized protein PHACADRAFT_211447 [Phanerochaete carnosa HHB-10118-sp]|uniref:Glucose-methanol-choline oxidoreductase N-terminal domain-containing protein n=1 Tax=Phanerochaete carnosa (strain HHB-10118-sp) TaxID=650164 RepID=K5VQT9_PHACS|nr:uncharacterized protein PHACADRAFT_211447 [Phanerochaete carnosa HHB-10118-sp]EKM53803.1 hypothetical protein PHACADRAFT_211447 [Phanerochaete carnosa HHB-10118-sp]